MKIGRRSFLKTASLGAAYMAAGNGLQLLNGGGGSIVEASQVKSFKYRIAFGAWINDMRLSPLPLEDWPAPQFDDETIESAIRAMDVQAKAGYNMLDAMGLFATYGWPADIVSAVDKDRRRRINKLLKAAKDRGIEFVLCFGNYSWGYDKIMEADPAVRGKNPDGTPHGHAMCDANPKSFEYVKKMLDFALGEFDFGAVHLESCDQGCCWCPECAGKDGVVGYNVRINQKAADYIKQNWPDKTVYVITINWIPGATHFSDDQKAQVLELSKHVDCIFDQGHTGFQVDPNERKSFIRKMHCTYGTSGDLWLYPDTRWDRSSFFLPFVKRAGDGIKAQYEDGVRGCLYYQGPVSNAGTEVQIAVGGRIMSDTSRNVEDTLAEVIDLYYKPKNAQAQKQLVDIFLRAEESYFSNWPNQTELFKKLYGFVPGEFKLYQGLFGTTPGPSTYLKDPMLDAKGRAEYKKGLISILKDIPEIKGKYDDHGRIDNIERSVMITLNTLNTISMCLGEG